MIVTTHVLDTARGIPAAGTPVALYAVRSDTRTIVREAVTNGDGRTDEPLGIDLSEGTYELVFAAGNYFARSGIATFYDEIAVRFQLDGTAEKYHVPLLVSPWGYATYRGS